MDDDYSSHWKRPSEVMKMYRKKKRRMVVPDLRKEDGQLAARVFRDSTACHLNWQVPPARVVNPFRSGAPGHRRPGPSLADHGGSPGCSAGVRGLIRILSLREELEAMAKEVGAGRSDSTNPPAAATPRADTAGTIGDLPADWSLKLKMRATSDRPFAWCAHLKSSEEALGVSSFLQHSPGDLPEEEEGDTSRVAFQRCRFYWLHPNIPWVKSFPRMTPAGGGGGSSLSAEMRSALHADWSESFSSVFCQLKSRLCPYFYLCTHQFTALFQSADAVVVTATISPTTRGFREALDNEGIAFKMPLNKRRPVRTPESSRGRDGGEASLSEDGGHPSPGQLNPTVHPPGGATEGNQSGTKEELLATDNGSDEDDLLTTGDSAGVWLESIGLDKRQFPSLDPVKLKLSADNFRAIDNQPESVICIEGIIHVQALFNFLLNWKACFAVSGPQADLPPTILAPVGFKGSTLKSLKVKQSCAKRKDPAGANRKSYVLEITGPILPHHVLGFLSLFQRTQQQEFSLQFATHEPTAPLNCRTFPGVLEGGERGTNGAVTVNGRFIREITCSSSGFSWFF